MTAFYYFWFVQVTVCGSLNERRFPSMDKPAIALDRAFHALSDPNRRAILAVVRDGHRAVLRDAGLVTDSRSGTRHLYAVRVEGLAVSKAFFDDFWPERLSALKRAVEEFSHEGADV
jgi:DNA-binding transcriptional ArsR family regulator